MNERRQFLKVLGGSAMLWMGCQSGGAAIATGEDGGAPAGDDLAGAADAAVGNCANLKEVSSGANNDLCGSNAGTFALGTPADFSTMGLHKVTNIPSGTLIGRDAAGLYALSSMCTHQCCDMNDSQRGMPNGTFTTRNGKRVIRCNCHSSAFNLDGSVAAGPATTPLDAYALQLGCDGQLYVDTTKVVPNTQRLVA